MMKNIYIALALLLFTGCMSTKVMHNSSPEINITDSKTYSFYGWFGETNDLIDVDKKAFEKAFAAELKKRGLTYQKTNGDIVFSLFVVVDKKSTTNHYNAFYGNGLYGFYQPMWGWGYTGSFGYHNSPMPYAGVLYKENAYLQGTIVCDAFDLKTKKLAWQGVATKAINPNKKYKESPAPKIVKKIMRGFPIEVTKK